MKHAVTIDTPELDVGITSYTRVFGLEQIAWPIPVSAMHTSDDANLGNLEKAGGAQPAAETADRCHDNRLRTPVRLDIEVDHFDATPDRLITAGRIREQDFAREGRPEAAFCADPFGNGFCLLETGARWR